MQFPDSHCHVSFQGCTSTGMILQVHLTKPPNFSSPISMARNLSIRFNDSDEVVVFALPRGVPYITEMLHSMGIFPWFTLKKSWIRWKTSMIPIKGILQKIAHGHHHTENNQFVTFMVSWKIWWMDRAEQNLIQRQMARRSAIGSHVLRFDFIAARMWDISPKNHPSGCKPIWNMSWRWFLDLLKQA